MSTDHWARVGMVTTRNRCGYSQFIRFSIIADSDSHQWPAYLVFPAQLLEYMTQLRINISVT